MENNRYRISELAQKAGVTKRTIHYYMGRGLLPSPDGAGLGTTYSDEHLYRVKLIKKLQDAYLPLDEIRKRMAGMKPEDVRENLMEHAGAGRNSETGIIAKDGAEAAGNTGDGSISTVDGIRGAVYERLNVGFGLEIHYPGDSGKARELADKLYKYAEKVLKEG